MKYKLNFGVEIETPEKETQVPKELTGLIIRNDLAKEGRAL